MPASAGKPSGAGASAGFVPLKDPRRLFPYLKKFILWFENRYGGIPAITAFPEDSWMYLFFNHPVIGYAESHNLYFSDYIEKTALAVSS
jgi:hypothetical protein